MAKNSKDTRPMESSDQSHPPRDDADLGGMPTNLQHGLFDDGQGTRTSTEPVHGDWAKRAAAGAAEAWADADVEEDKRARPGAKPPSHIDNPLESLGKAVTEPAWSASGEADKSGQPGGDRSAKPRVP